MKRAETLGESFRYAFRGLWYALQTQRNLRLHVTAACWILALGWVLALPQREFITLLVAIIVVMVAEMVNTAIEAAVDLASPHFHPLAQTAKDVAAGAVLLAAIGAAALGLWVFASHITQIPGDFVVRWKQSPMATAVVVAALVCEWIIVWRISVHAQEQRRPGPSR
ncbi:MAG: diacylglycerol kinase family protein [Thermaerobacter sp.]|nr:diacylglycerol kinase family protein [Thermaerobacter sp.]